MTYEYEREEIADHDVAERLAARGADGWRLAAMAMHPQRTSDAEPVLVTVWERTLP